MRNVAGHRRGQRRVWIFFSSSLSFIAIKRSSVYPAGLIEFHGDGEEKKMTTTMDRVQSYFFFFFWKAQKTDIERNTRNVAIVFDPRIRRRRNANASSRSKISAVFFFVSPSPAVGTSRGKSRIYAPGLWCRQKHSGFVGVTVRPPAVSSDNVRDDEMHTKVSAVISTRSDEIARIVIHIRFEPVAPEPDRREWFFFL